MADKDAIRELVLQARAGQNQAMDTLARRVEGRVSAYIYRVTLDRDLTQDLCQEVLLTMIRSLRDLHDADRLWPWLYRIAQSKIQQHFRTKQRRHSASEAEAYRDFVTQQADPEAHDGLRRVMNKELVKKTLAAIRQLSTQYRAVLSLRCFEQMPYADIALAMDCSEVKARVTFCRAKDALKKQLNRQGVRKGMLLACLGAFGKLTAPADATAQTVTVTAGCTQVGLITIVLASVTTKVGLAAAAAVAAVSLGVAGMGTVSAWYRPALPPRAQVQSLHFTAQLRNSDPQAPASLSKGAYEQWFHFPAGVDGPVFFRMQRWDASQKSKLCAWLQNAEGNYYYASGTGKVHLNNYRVFWSNLDVRRLPSDGADFTAFLDQVEGGRGGVKMRRDRRTGMLTGAVDRRFADARNFRTEYDYNTLGAETFDYDWPASTPTVDERDAMRRRGWAYFRIAGRAADRAVTGCGQMPFFHASAQDHPAWLRVSVGDDLELIDGPAGAVVRSAGRVVATYQAGTFFEGLGRPWMGMHTLDTIRRDAVQRRIWFKTEADKEIVNAKVTWMHAARQRTNVLYFVDLEGDLIDRIEFWINDQISGGLRLSYLQDTDAPTAEFDMPELPADLTTTEPDVPWLIALARGEIAP